jgi:non-specific serine/threonine protein kinase/serine/threonine-protein kinase
LAFEDPMTRDEWHRIKSVAVQAWEQPASDRAAFIDAACAGDDELRREVESLVRSAVEAETMYEGDALWLPAAQNAVDLALGPAVIGTRVDSYRIVRELGHGGMGRVYLAERADGEFDQQVAIKLVGAGLFTEPLRERFREERRILAALDHPNIARLIDGGTMPDGQPYVVMEYVGGSAIDEYCEARALSIRDRVALFRTVCGAVHHAHQRLVIHRDIKASNILVTPEGVPKLLDFGIATLVDPSVPATERGRTIVRAHTPESASPEQIRGEPITLTADVYALGNLLYGLLTGRLPYGETTGSEAELARAICEDIPEAPSAIARRIGRAPVDGDLDAIVLKALRKEPDRRYSSADALSEDLLRWLQARPVLATPDSRRYRASKFVKRHRAGVAAGAAAMAAVLAGTAIAVQQAGVARRERLQAERRFNEVRHVASSFLFEFHDAIAELPGALRARRLVVKRAAEYLDQLSREAKGNASLERELATAYQRLGEIEGGVGVSSLGDLSGAERHYARALSLREALASGPDARDTDFAELSALRVLLSRLMLATGRLDAAQENAASAIAVLTGRGAVREHLGALSVAHHQLGFVQAQRNDPAALTSLRTAYELAARHAHLNPRDPTARARLARNEADYADALLKSGRTADALEHARTARQRFEALVAADPLNARTRQNLALAFSVEAHALGASGDDESAIAAFTSAVETAEALLSAEPANQGSQITVMLNHYELGMGLIRAGRVAAGIQRLRQAIAEGEAIVKASPGAAFMASQLAAVKVDLGSTLLASDPVNTGGCRLLEDGLASWARGGRQVPEQLASQKTRFDPMVARCRAR